MQAGLVQCCAAVPREWMERHEPFCKNGRKAGDVLAAHEEKEVGGGKTRPLRPRAGDGGRGAKDEEDEDVAVGDCNSAAGGGGGSSSRGGSVSSSSRNNSRLSTNSSSGGGSSSSSSSRGRLEIGRVQSRGGEDDEDDLREAATEKDCTSCSGCSCIVRATAHNSTSVGTNVRIKQEEDAEDTSSSSFNRRSAGSSKSRRDTGDEEPLLLLKKCLLMPKCFWCKRSRRFVGVTELTKHVSEAHGKSINSVKCSVLPFFF